MEKLDLVKVQSPSALLKANILSALWLHCLIKLSPVIKLSVKKTIKYEIRERIERWISRCAQVSYSFYIIA